MWWRTVARSCGVSRSHTGDPKMTIASSGRPCGFSGSRSCDQSMREVGVPLQVLALLVEPPQRLRAVLVLPLEDGRTRRGSTTRSARRDGVAIDACHGGPLPRHAGRARLTDAAVRGALSSRSQHFAGASVQAPAPALAPERRHVDAEARGRFLQRRGLGEHLAHVAPLQVLERGAALGSGGLSGAGASSRSGRSSASMVAPRARTRARSSAFTSSRTLPGQRVGAQRGARRRRRADTGRAGGGRTASPAECSTSAGRSSRRSRSGGSAMPITFRR